jgi:hypothetical protein
MKTTLKKVWAVVKPATILSTAYALLPLCIAAFAGLAGLVVVAALDLWFDVYFVDGVPAASTLVAIASLSGLWLLKSPGQAALRSRFLSSLRKAKAALSSLSLRRFTRAMTEALDAARRFPTRARGTRASRVEPDHVSRARTWKKTEARPLIHSVVWGKPISRRFDMNCPANLEVDNIYDARK